jgi:hypothetical protein
MTEQGKSPVRMVRGTGKSLIVMQDWLRQHNRYSQHGSLDRASA